MLRCLLSFSASVGISAQTCLNNEHMTTTEIKYKSAPGVQKVVLTGNFDCWSKSLEMKNDIDSQIWVATVVSDLEALEFKFILDDSEWVTSQDFKTVADENGNLNNTISFDAPVDVPVDAAQDVAVASPLVQALMVKYNQETNNASSEDIKQSPLLEINGIRKNDTLVEDAFVDAVETVPVVEPVKNPAAKKEGIFRKMTSKLFKKKSTSS